MRPVLLVTGHAPADRVAPLAALHEREGIEVALFGGRDRHGAPAATNPLPVPHRAVDQRAVHGLAASGRYRAVIAGLGGRVAPLAAALGARRAHVPFLLWTGLWAHPRSPAHVLSYAPTLWLYRHADALVTYGPHVSRYVEARGARNVHVAPQAVDPAFWGERGPGRRERGFQVLFVGRPAVEKGRAVLLEAWPDAVCVGDPPVSPEEVRNFLAGSDVLVVASLRTPSFREPWGLIVNEAMLQRVPVIATDQVGAAAGGLVRHERTGLVVPAGDPGALRAAIERLRDDPALRERLAAAAAATVTAYTPAAWAAGMSAALASVGAGRAGRDHALAS
ncbi:MAG: glycosyltransferase family 4 protein [Solirubrobacteraceae bacterium]